LPIKIIALISISFPFIIHATDSADGNLAPIIYLSLPSGKTYFAILHPSSKINRIILSKFVVGIIRYSRYRGTRANIFQH